MSQNIKEEKRKCKSCNGPIIFTFILPVIDKSGLCPKCFREAKNNGKFKN